MDESLQSFITVIFELSALTAVLTQTASCIKKRRDDITPDAETPNAAIISYPEKPVFPVASSTRVVASEIDVELALNQLEADQPVAAQPVVEVNCPTAPEKEVASACEQSAGSRPARDMDESKNKDEHKPSDQPVSPCDPTQTSAGIKKNGNNQMKADKMERKRSEHKCDLTQESELIGANVNTCEPTQSSDDVVEEQHIQKQNLVQSDTGSNVSSLSKKGNRKAL